MGLNKLGYMDFFFNLLRSQDVFVIAGSEAGFKTYEVSGYASYFKGRFEVAKYDRNPGGLTVCIR
jgi:hypothetical protein